MYSPVFGSPDSVPEMVRSVVFLVLLSVVEPVSSAELRSRAPELTVGSVVSTVMDSGEDFGLSTLLVSVEEAVIE